MKGLRVPQDLSVIGLDDIDFAEFTLPPLTTIRLSRADLARAAFEALRQQAEDPAIRRCSASFWCRRAWCCAARQPRRPPRASAPSTNEGGRISLEVPPAAGM